MTFLDEAAWRGRVYSDGWASAAGGEAAVTEPGHRRRTRPDGDRCPGRRSPGGRRAAAAQPAWAALPHTERSAILRRAADIGWPMPGKSSHGASGKAGGTRGGSVRDARRDRGVYEAATLPSQPYGELIPSEQPRLSFAERVPAGVVGVIAPFNFPQILAIRSVAPALALGNAVVLKPDPRTAVCGGVVLARVFEEAGLPAGSCTCFRAARRPGRR